MFSVSRSRHVDTPPARVYAAFVDIGSWLAWVPHFRSVTPLSQQAIVPGFRARIGMKLCPAEGLWEVIEHEPERSFAWENRGVPGVRLVVDHIVEPEDGGSRVSLRVDIDGPLALPVWLTSGLMTRLTFDRSLTALQALLEDEAVAVVGEV